MKKLTTVFIVLLFVATFALTQNYYRRNSNYPRYFNPETITTVEGKIIGIDSVKMRVYATTRLNVQTKNGPIYIHVAPYWFLENNKILFKIGEPIKVTGSKVIYNNKPVIIASQLKYNGKELKLRDANGFPVWAGRRGNNKGKGMGRGQGRRRF